MNKTEDCTDIDMSKTVSDKRIEGLDSAEAPFLSELSCTMTEASIESLDLLSPAGTPMRSWLTCFQPKTGTLDFEYYPNDFKAVEFSPMSASPSIPEDSVMEFHDEESTTDAVDSDHSFEEECFEVQVLDSSFEAEVTLTEIALASFIECNEIDAQEEYEVDTGSISSIDILWALAWVILSVAVLQGHKVPLEEIELAAVHAFDFLKDVLLPFVNDYTFQAAQMANAVTAEAVCAVIGSSCIA